MCSLLLLLVVVHCPVEAEACKKAARGRNGVVVVIVVVFAVVDCMLGKASRRRYPTLKWDCPKKLPISH